MAAGGGDARVELPEEVELPEGLGDEVELEVPFTGDVRATGGVALVLFVEFWASTAPWIARAKAMAARRATRTG